MQLEYIHDGLWATEVDIFRVCGFVCVCAYLCLFLGKLALRSRAGNRGRPTQCGLQSQTDWTPVPGTIRPIVDVVIGPLGNSYRAELRIPHSIIWKNWGQVFLQFLFVL